MYNNANPAGEAGYVCEFKRLSVFDVPDVQIYNDAYPARDVGQDFEISELLVFNLLTEKLLNNNVNPPWDAVITYHTSHKFKELLTFIVPPEK